MRAYGFDGVSQIDGIVDSLVSEPAVPYFPPGRKARNHAICQRNYRSDWQHPADQTQTSFGSDRLHHPRQGRIHESRSVGQGPGGLVHHQGRGAKGRVAARRHYRRRHGGQHRHRPCSGRQCHGLPQRHRHSGNAKPREEGHAAAVRRGIDRSPGGALFQSQQLRKTLRAACRAIGQVRIGRRDLGKSVRQRRQSPRPYRDDGPGNLASNRRQG